MIPHLNEDRKIEYYKICVCFLSALCRSVDRAKQPSMIHGSRRMGRGFCTKKLKLLLSQTGRYIIDNG